MYCKVDETRQSLITHKKALEHWKSQITKNVNKKFKIYCPRTMTKSHPVVDFFPRGLKLDSQE